MDVGALVEVVFDFSKLGKSWGIKYPKRGEILTVESIAQHPVYSHLRVLKFVERPELPELCYRQYNGTYNFREINIPVSFLKEVAAVQQ